MAPRTLRIPQVAAIALLVAGTSPLGASRAFAATSADGAEGRVQPSDSRAAALVRTAAALSPTVATLLGNVRQQDVIVFVQVAFVPNGVAGDLRFVSVAAGHRILMIRVSPWQSPEEQAAILGHELQHAREVADAPDVTDVAGHARLLVRIGRSTGHGTFETDAAVRVARQVRREVSVR